MRIYWQAQQRPSVYHNSRLCTIACQTNPCRRNCALCLLWQVQAQRHLMSNRIITSSHKHNPSVIIHLSAAAHDTPIQVHLRRCCSFFFQCGIRLWFCIFQYRLPFRVYNNGEDGGRWLETTRRTRLNKFPRMDNLDCIPSEGIGAVAEMNSGDDNSTLSIPNLYWFLHVLGAFQKELASQKGLLPQGIIIIGSSFQHIVSSYSDISILALINLDHSPPHTLAHTSTREPDQWIWPKHFESSICGEGQGLGFSGNSCVYRYE